MRNLTAPIEKVDTHGDFGQHVHVVKRLSKKNVKDLNENDSNYSKKCGRRGKRERHVENYQ